MADRALTVKQPFADLIMAGVKTVENRTRPVPSTLPQWQQCPGCLSRVNGQPGWCGFCDVARHDDGPFPFRLMIHAAAQEDTYNFADLRGLVVGTPRAEELIQAYHVKVSGAPRLGALLGTVEVTGCHHANDCRRWGEGDGFDPVDTPYFCSRWAEPDRWHWTLADPRPLDEPVPMKGQLGLWRVPAEVTADA